MKWLKISSIVAFLGVFIIFLLKVYKAIIGNSSAEIAVGEPRKGTSKSKADINHAKAVKSKAKIKNTKVEINNIKNKYSKVVER